LFSQPSSPRDTTLDRCAGLRASMSKLDGRSYVENSALKDNLCRERER